MNIDPATISILEKAGIALAAAIVGFVARWYLAARRERWALKRSIPQMRAEAFQKLWPLCSQDFSNELRAHRAQRLRNWYESGGGLFLSLPASERYDRAIRLLEADFLSPKQVDDLRNDLTWLRTQLKYHVGSYSWREAKTQIKPPKDYPTRTRRMEFLDDMQPTPVSAAAATTPESLHHSTAMTSQHDRRA